MIGVVYKCNIKIKKAPIAPESFRNNPMCFTAPLMDEDPFVMMAQIH